MTKLYTLEYAPADSLGKSIYNVPLEEVVAFLEPRICKSCWAVPEVQILLDAKKEGWDAKQIRVELEANKHFCVPLNYHTLPLEEKLNKLLSTGCGCEYDCSVVE